jgi:hypothetical protein
VQLVQQMQAGQLAGAVKSGAAAAKVSKPLGKRSKEREQRVPELSNSTRDRKKEACQRLICVVHEDASRKPQDSCVASIRERCRKWRPVPSGTGRP